MFGTLKYDKKTKDFHHIQILEDDNVDARGHILVACDSCRAQKVFESRQSVICYCENMSWGSVKSKHALC